MPSFQRRSPDEQEALLRQEHDKIRRRLEEQGREARTQRQGLRAPSTAIKEEEGGRALVADDWTAPFRASGWAPTGEGAGASSSPVAPAASPTAPPGGGGLGDWVSAFKQAGWTPGGAARGVASAAGGAASDVEGYIRKAAAQRGIDPDIAVRVAQSEGGTTEPARRGTFATGLLLVALPVALRGRGHALREVRHRGRDGQHVHPEDGLAAGRPPGVAGGHRLRPGCREAAGLGGVVRGPQAGHHRLPGDQPVRRA